MMKAGIMFVNLAVALACLVSTNAFVMPRVGASGSAAPLAEKLAPAVTQLASSRPTGEMSRPVTMELSGDPGIFFSYL